MRAIPLLLCLTACPLAAAVPASAPATRPIETAAGEIAAWLPPSPIGVGRPMTDRDAWRRPAPAKLGLAAVPLAEAVAAQPVPALTDDLYREFSRTGNRRSYESVMSQRRTHLNALVLAECAEDRGRFLPKIVEYVEAFCDQPTWVWPAHDKTLGNFQGRVVEIDLSAAELGWQLATARWLLGERLPPAVNEKVAQNVTRRIIEPYVAAATGKAKPFSWMTRTNNWNAVCHAGVVGATLATAPDRTVRALVIASADRHLRHFLDGFGPDGYCSEGLGYWNYGFGHYALLAETVRQATAGRVDLMDRPGVRAAAMFGDRITITGGAVPAFADCPINARPAPQLTRYVGARFAPADDKADPFEVRSERAYLYDVAIHAFLEPARLPKLSDLDGSGDDSPLRTWFSDAGVLIARPPRESACRIGVALKGGHNAEHHNHNDLGSYVVVLDGHPLLLDPGTEHYTARTFGPNRYDSKLLNSFGHPVPVVAGQLQRAGAKSRAEIVRTEFTGNTDTVVMDLTGAYSVPELKRLERTFVYDRRGTGTLTISDRFDFATPQSFGTALITLGRVTDRDGGAFSVEDDKRSLRVRVDAGGAGFDVASSEIRENAPVVPTRIGIDLREKVTSGGITIRIGVP